MALSQTNPVNEEYPVDQKFDAIFQNNSLGILLVNKEGTIVSLNKFLLSQFGYDKEEELLGAKVELLIPARFQGHHVKDRDNYIHHPQRRPMGAGRDLFGKKKSGDEFPVE